MLGNCKWKVFCSGERKRQPQIHMIVICIYEEGKVHVKIDEESAIKVQ